MAQPRTIPHSSEAEQSVLGSMMLDNRCIPDVVAMLAPADFYLASHSAIYEAITDMYDKRQPVDFVTLSNVMKARGKLDEAGGMAYLSQLADHHSSANVEAYVRIVHERAFQRRVIAAGWEISETGYDSEGSSIEEMRSTLDKIVLNATATKSIKEPQTLGQMSGAWYDDLQHRKTNSIAGMYTGLRDLDVRMAGLEPGDYWLVIGATGSGKTMFALNVADYFAQHHGPVLGVSLEMPSRQWLARRIAARAGVDSMKLRRPMDLDQRDEDSIVWATGQIQNLPFYVDDTPGQTLRHIRTSALRLMRKTGRKLSLLMIDYVQLMVGDRQRGDNRVNELLGISRGLKSLAKELDCPLLVLAQVNGDEIMKRDDKRPRITDIGEAKGMAYDADHVGGIYNDEYYHKNSADKGIMEYIGIKARSGPRFKIELDFNAPHCKISDYNGPTSSERNPQKKAAAKKGSGLVEALKGKEA